MNSHAMALPEEGSALLLCCPATLCEQDIGKIRSVLSSEDQARLDTCRNDSTRQNFAAGRGLIHWLQRRMGHPGEIALKWGEHGKPCFAVEGPWKFNLSHSAGKIAMVITQGQEAGFDMESAGRRVNIKALSHRVFHPEECQWWKARGEKIEDFFRIWTLKEAWLKMSGEGIRVELATLNLVPWVEEGIYQGVTAIFPEVAPGFLASLMVEGPCTHLHVHRGAIQDLI